ncbi:MAG: transketolase, partial [Gammaproteobacteria bacterium]
VFVLLGDGECNEGSVWEAAALASELDVSNLVAIVDQNHLRNDGLTTTYEHRIKLAKLWEAFGWNVLEVDGHNHDQIRDALADVTTPTDAPTAIVAQTIKGKGIPFMEANNDWHHNRITASLYEECITALESVNV